MKKEGREKEKVEKGRGKKGREKYSKIFFFFTKNSIRNAFKKSQGRP